MENKTISSKKKQIKTVADSSFLTFITLFYITFSEKPNLSYFFIPLNHKNKMNFAERKQFLIDFKKKQEFELKFCSKKRICEEFEISKNTFNKYFKSIFDKHDLHNKRKFKFSEIKNIYFNWMGKGIIYRSSAISKKELINVLENSNYKKLANEFNCYLNNHELYKNQDKFSPKQIEEFLDHIDVLDNKKILKKLNKPAIDEMRKIRDLFVLALYYAFDS
ncbi:hypothetical protein [Aureivirga sp. CE67]|uniref:hypothetical protein n=1 Tax=Aureivirga sp. CE67 TaxID=1788983 RepID=UPI0018C8ED2D|nr:hypothetical protein [Aureivirga sp. CE67]